MFATLSTLQACGGGGGSGEDAGGPDADASELCSMDVDCSDGLFCNGDESCLPEDPGADALGCVPAAADACSGEVCDEISDSCSAGCGMDPDADGDGHDSVACGGDDCDDSDTNRFPGNAEVCDLEDHDEDCDPRTFGIRDADGDAAPDAQCCNVDADSMVRFCGDDCDDTRITVSPTSPETCDELDNDCDSLVDEGVLEIFYIDADGDDFGSSHPDAETMMACVAPTGFASMPTDCDDDNNAVNPGLVDPCDGVDNDCDMVIDEDTTLTTYYLDADGDGIGLVGDAVEACAAPPGRVLTSGDCDDDDSALHPGAAELCDELDNDCDTTIDEGSRIVFYRDADNDMFGNPAEALSVLACVRPTGFADNPDDCDDAFAASNPGAPEVCDERDNDCDLGIDETVLTEYFRDADGDGFGDATAATTFACSVPPGFATNTTDCDDLESASNPGAPEVCDSKDNDCDTTIDEATSVVPWYADTDRDGFGDPAAATIDSCAPVSGRVTNNGDCDDADAGRNPSAPEVCDTRDNDCDTTVDEGVLNTYYLDSDADSFGSLASTAQACTAPANHVTNFGDCNDGDNAISPLASEACDSVDNDCDTIVDEGGAETYYRDGDDDGQGAPGGPLMSTSCTAPAGFTTASGDCNDSDDTIFAGAPELCDRKDNDCSATGGAEPLEDGDGDGHAPTGAACTGGFPRDDCNDSAPTVYVGAPELCDRLDNDCSSGGGADVTEDSDDDGHAPTGASCSGVLPRNDCNDSAATVYGGAPELCDRLDNDCSTGGGAATEEDMDGDEHSPPGAACDGGFPEDDCNESDASIYPGALELCDRVDNNCSGGGGPDFAEDMDSDGYAPLTASCNGGFPRSDCADMNPAVHPGAEDICNDVDDDCDSTVDEAGSADAWCGPAATCFSDGCRYYDELAAGEESTCAVVGGLVRCWGMNDNGKAGDGTTSRNFAPSQVTGLVDALEVDTDSWHTCALRATGQVECWGSNWRGQLGNGLTGSGGPTPQLVTGINNAISIATGENRSCAVLATGEVRCWGSEYVGDGSSFGGGSTPQMVTGITDGVQVSAGLDRTCVRHASGKVSCWGQQFLRNAAGVTTLSSTELAPVEIAGISDALYVAVGGFEGTTADEWSHTCVLHQDGTVSCWGENEFGQVGDGTTIDRFAPVAVPGLTDVQRLAAGGSHTCAVRRSGETLCWGQNDEQQSTQQLGGMSFVPVGLPSLTTTELVSTGWHHSCARMLSGDIRCWGGDPDLLGGTFLGVLPVTGVTGAVSLDGGGGTTCAMLTGGTVECWGDNGRGQLGRGTTVASNVPGAVTGISTAVDVGVGLEYACAVLADGTARCWGNNNNRQLGDLSLTSSSTPVMVSGLSTVETISAGRGHTCASLADGTVRCWGNNSDGQLGIGTTGFTGAIETVMFVTGASRVELGNNHSCTFTGGSMRCWGEGVFGALGSGTNIDSSTAVTVSGLTDAVAFGAGLRNTCAVRAGGTVQCWGPGSSGQIGHGTTAGSFVPATVSGITDAVDVDAGDHACAVLAGGTVQCWGRGQEGQLGQGSTPNRQTTPVTTVGVSNAETVTTGDRHTCALLATGTVACWGDQTAGRLGAPFEPVVVDDIP